MDLQIGVINPIDYPGWDDLLLSNRYYSFFHSSHWAKVLTSSYNYKPLYFTIIDGGRLLALLPLMEVKSAFTGHRGVSLPFSDYCDPIVSDDASFHEILNASIDYGKKAGWKYVEIRGGNDCLKEKSFSSYTYGHTLDLSSDERDLFSRFRNSTKRNIKKAIKEGVEVSICDSAESVSEFYRLNCLTRKMHGLPPQPSLFFNNIFEHIISKKLGFLVHATYKGQHIAGAVYLHIGRKAIYKYGASDRSFQHLRANNLVMWEAIKWYAQNGFTRFCFGRTETENKGLIQFKTGWGAKERTINYYKYDLRKKEFIKDSSSVSGFHNNLFRMMPIRVSCLVGEILYKHVG